MQTLSKLSSRFFYLMSFVIVLSACSSDDDENNDKTPPPPEPVSIEEATSGEYEMTRFDADLVITIESFNVDLVVDIKSKNFVGKLSFEEQKVIFDNSFDAIVQDESGVIVNDTLNVDLKAKMSFEIVSESELRFYVDENDPEDEPLVLVNGLELDDIKMVVEESTTEKFRLKGDVDTEIEIGGFMPGMSGKQPTKGFIYITLER